MEKTAEVASAVPTDVVAAAKDAAALPAVAFSSFRPQLVVPPSGAANAVAFYVEAFGAEELSRVSYPKRKAEQDAPAMICAEVGLGGSVFLVCDGSEGDAAAKETSNAAAGVLLLLETADVKGAVERAVSAGAVMDGEVEEDAEGAMVAKVNDPFGFLWTISSAASETGGAEAEEA